MSLLVLWEAELGGIGADGLSRHDGPPAVTST